MSIDRKNSPRRGAFAAACLLAAAAAASAREACPAAQSFSSAVLNCGLNTVATDHARTCAARVRQQADDVAVASRAALASRDPANMEAAAKTIVATIKTMQGESDTVAHYTEAMIDLPGSASRETSLECFNTEFDKIQTLLNEMDGEIVAAIASWRELGRAYAALKRGPKR